MRRILSGRRLGGLLTLALAAGLARGHAVAPASASRVRALIAPAVAAALADPAHPLRRPDGRLKVWVRFRDRDVAPGRLEAELAAARATLSPRALARRERAAVAAGTAAVDARDLPLAPRYLARCEATGAELHRHSRWLNAASFLADDAQLRRLAALPEVAAIEPVARFARAAVPTPVADARALMPAAPKAQTVIDYGDNAAAMAQANVPAAHEQLGVTGAGVVVGMLDTGFRTQHVALAHIPVLGAWDFVNDDPVVDNEPGDPASSRSHGTMTLSTVAAHAPGALVAPAWNVGVLLGKTEDVSQEVPAEEDHWVAGLEWCEAQGADIISSSLGYIDWYLFANLDGATCVTTVAADLAAGRGLLVVNSAGNDRTSTGHLIAPADGDSVVTVGAVDAAGVVTWFSSPGPTADGRLKPDVAALGQSNRVVDPENDLAYRNASGTSFSCPLVTGVAALVLERVPGLLPMQVLAALRATAGQAATPDNDTGWGIVDAYAAATWFGPVFAHQPLAATQAVAGPWAVSATVDARLGLAGTPELRWRVAGSPWQEAAMIPNGPPDLFSGQIPAAIGGVTVEYYLAATDGGGHATTWPVGGALAPFAFTVAPGTSPVGDMPVVAAAWLAPAAPNPFNPQTTLRYGLQAAGPARLEIIDARGRRVRTLLDGAQAAGDHVAVWDGRDDRGRAAPSGVYFCRLVAGGAARQQKLHLVR
ncbi:MAG: S8 family serine peptidase [bacterium]|nr:S8 family serine peptidase [bacterium]